MVNIDQYPEEKHTWGYSHNYPITWVRPGHPGLSTTEAPEGLLTMCNRAHPGNEVQDFPGLDLHSHQPTTIHMKLASSNIAMD